MNELAITSSPSWVFPPNSLDLQPLSVEVWRGTVDLPFPRLQEFWDLLSCDEQARAKRLKFPQHRNRFIAARGMLRSILGKYLQAAPKELSFGLGAHGKPFLLKEHCSIPLSFNVTHSYNLALYALSLNRAVGVDVEYERADIHYQGMVSRIFSEEESSFFWTLPQEKHLAAFFSCWTKKEAYLKARGYGLAFPLRNISVGFTSEQPAGLLKINADPQETSRWKLHELFPQDGYKAAVVALGQDWNLQCWEFSP